MKFYNYIGPCSLLFLMSACAQITAKQQEYSELDDLTLPYYTWMDPYYQDVGEKRFFNVAKLIENGYAGNRMEALDIQNRYRDAMDDIYASEINCDKTKLRPDNEPYKMECVSDKLRWDIFTKAVDDTKHKGVESQWTTSELDGSYFVVAFDLDETLYRYNKKQNTIILAPGWKDALKNIVAEGGAVVFFTARPDKEVNSIMNGNVVVEDGAKVKWTITKDVPMRDYVKGMFTNHHLTKQYESDSEALVLLGSKDLRLIDPSLENVVLIDDNPSRVWQTKNLRFIRKWKPDGNDDSQNYDSTEHREFYEKRLLNAVDEIINSAKWAGDHQMTLAQAFLPYSYAGRQVTQEIANVMFKGDWQKAVDYVRTHPELVDK